MNTQKMSALEIRRRALRAAGQVALWTTLACGGEANTTGLQAQVAPSPGPTDEPNNGLVVEALPEEVVAAQVETTTTAAEVCDRTTSEESWEEYLACCQRIGWDWDRGCAAWGPPVPPSLGVFA